MLRKLTIKNFQNHKHTVIEFDGVTVFVGPNGAGKSAILRALRWVAFNEWDGPADGMTTWGEEFTSVELVTDKHTVERRRSKDFNGYILDGDEVRFDSVNRRSVPEVISKALNLSRDSFQTQYEGAYWMSLTPGQAAKALNRIVNLDAIDQTLDLAAQEVRRSRERERVCEERLAEAKQLVDQTKWVVQANKALCTLEQLQKRLVEKASRIASAERLLVNGYRLIRLRDHAWMVAKQGQAVLALAQEIERTRSRYWPILDLIVRIEAQEQRKSKLQEDLRRKTAEYKALMEDGCPLCGVRDGQA